MSAIRILRIHSWDGQVGGAENYIHAIDRALAPKGFETRLLSLVSSPPDTAGPGETFVRVPPPNPRRYVTDLRAHGHVAQAIGAATREFAPDLIHLHHFDAAFGEVAAALRSTELPILFTGHDAELVCPNGQLVRPGGIICEGGIRPRCGFTGCPVGWGLPYELAQRVAFDRYVAPRIRAYICPSESLRRYLTSQGYRPTIHLPSFAVQPPAILQAPPAYPEPSAPLTIGFLGRIELYKGLRDLVDAVALLRRRLNGVRLAIAGAGAADSDLDRYLAERDLTGATQRWGMVGGSAKEEFFRSIHLLVVPSNKFENSSLSAMEAMARARPVVGTDIGGIPEVLGPDLAGLVVPIADPARLAQVMEDLLTHRPEALRLGELARRRALEVYTEARHVDGLVEVYRTVLGSQDPPPSEMVPTDH
ncbi:MAG: glycosyltransferase family 4 protein [Thermoplasmata archaeon]|jgi:glycosyltransferase involved in cell wall biosynthesis